MLVSLQRMPGRLPPVLLLSAVEGRLAAVHQDFVAERALWFLGILERWESPRCLVVSELEQQVLRSSWYWPMVTPVLNVQDCGA